MLRDTSIDTQQNGQRVAQVDSRYNLTRNVDDGFVCLMSTAEPMPSPARAWGGRATVRTRAR